MIARTLLIITIAAAVVRASNINCVVDAFDRERQEIGKQQSVRIARGDDLKKSPKQGEDGPVFRGRTFFQFTKQLVKDVIGIEDLEIEPISYATLINAYFREHTPFLSTEVRSWVNRQCLPFVAQGYRSTPRSLFVCTRLYQLRQVEVERMMKLEKLGYGAFGKVFKDAAESSEPEIDIETHREYFCTRESELKSAERSIDSFYDNVVDNFIDQFDSHLEKYFKQVDLVEEKCQLNTAIENQAIELQDKEYIRTAVGMVAVTSKAKLNAIGCQSIKDAISDYKGALKESVNSVAFVHFCDRIVERVKGKADAELLYQNVVFPHCVGAIIESGDHTNVKKIKVCKDVVQKLSNLLSKENMFAVRVLESREVLRNLFGTISQGAMIVRKKHGADFDKLASVVSENWERYLKHRLGLVSLWKVTTDSKGIREDLAVPLILTMQDLLNIEKQSASLLSDDFLLKFKQLSLNTVYDANAVTDFVESYRTETIKALGSTGKAIKAQQFNRKLSLRCELLSSSAQSKVCDGAIKMVNFKAVLHYRYTEFIFEVLGDKIARFLSKLNVEKSNQFEVTKLLAAQIEAGLTEIKADFERMATVYPTILETYGSTKLMMFVLAAKSAFSSDQTSLPDVIGGYIANFASQNHNELMMYKLRHTEFGSLLAKLKSLIAFKVADDKSAAEMLKTINAAESDSNIKEFGMSASQKKEIKHNLLPLFLNYDRFSESLKRKLSACVLREESYANAAQKCQSKNGKECLRLNPFLLAVPCAPGQELDSTGYCVASCPDMFTSAGIRFCKKPEIALIESRPDGATSTYRCAPGYQQEGLLCIPKCPFGWRDFGVLCERPNSAMNLEKAVLMIE